MNRNVLCFEGRDDTGMYMSEADICKEYREAKNKNAQVNILAEQNATKTGIILDILQRGGEEQENG